MKTSKILTFISFIIYILLTISISNSSNQAQQILSESDVNNNVTIFILIPFVGLVSSLWFWFHLRKKEHLAEQVKYARVISILLLVISVALYFVLPWFIFLPVYNLTTSL